MACQLEKVQFMHTLSTFTSKQYLISRGGGGRAPVMKP
jgi:hypothetical protein